jgi:D-arabinose 1-dehydrogenase-like Zn-dependent alcohol dehydrogenase
VYNAKAYSAASATSPLASAAIPRRDSTERDVQIEILFCGICHSDLHQVRNEWRDDKYLGEVTYGGYSDYCIRKTIASATPTI